MHFSAPDALDRARRIRLMIFDVDGVLTDGRIYIGEHGEAFKAFSTLDGHGLTLSAKRRKELIELVRKYNVRTEQLTDCSVCHR